MKKDRFLFEVQKLSIDLDRLIDEYDMREGVMTLFVAGVIDNMDGDEEDPVRLKAIYSYNLNNRLELEEILNFASDTFKDPDEPDIDDLLDGLGISLN